MHDIRWIREHPQEFDHALARRGLPAEASRLITWTNAAAWRLGPPRLRKPAQSGIETDWGRQEEQRGSGCPGSGCGNYPHEERDSHARSGREEVAKELRWTRWPSFRICPRRVQTRKDAPRPCRVSAIRSQCDNSNLQTKTAFAYREALADGLQAAAKHSGSRFVVLRSGLARSSALLGQNNAGPAHCGSTGIPRSTRRF
jgi:seryl-tRNA synthetase